MVEFEILAPSHSTRSAVIYSVAECSNVPNLWQEVGQIRKEIQTFQGLWWYLERVSSSRHRLAIWRSHSFFQITAVIQCVVNDHFTTGPQWSGWIQCLGIPKKMNIRIRKHNKWWTYLPTYSIPIIPYHHWTFPLPFSGLEHVCILLYCDQRLQDKQPVRRHVWRWTSERERDK